MSLHKFLDEFEWVYQNIGSDTARPEDAPSPSAFFILDYGRQARVKFTELALKHFTSRPRDSAEVYQREMEADRKRLQKMLDKLEPYCPHCGEIVRAQELRNQRRSNDHSNA